MHRSLRRRCQRAAHRIGHTLDTAAWRKASPRISYNGLNGTITTKLKRNIFYMA